MREHTSDGAVDRGAGPRTDGGPGRARIARRAADRVRGTLEDYLPRATRHRDSVEEADLEELIEWITDEVEADVNGRLRVLEREHYDHDFATDGGNDRGDGPRTDGGTSPDCPDCGHDLDTEENNDALAADEDHEYFCPRCGRLFNRVETDGGTSPACPDCGSATISRRQPGHAMSDPWVDTRWRCGDCGHRFDEPAETRANPGRSGLAGRLDDADADDLDRGDGSRTDGGERESEPETVWTLTCLDCEFDATITATGHPRDGPPDTVERTVTRHKHSTDRSHVVRVAGRLADRGDDIDPSLVTDGGATLCGRRTCDRDGTVAYETTRGAFRVRCPRHALADGVDGVGERRAETILDAMDLETLVEIATDIPEGHAPVTLSSLPGFGPTSARSVANAVAESPVADAVRCDEEVIGDA